MRGKRIRFLRKFVNSIERRDLIRFFNIGAYQSLEYNVMRAVRNYYRKYKRVPQL